MNYPILIRNLQKASKYFVSLGKTGYELGRLIESLSIKIINDSIIDNELKKLWEIFAPTCDWDDFRGDVDLGDDIFGDISTIFKDRIGKNTNSSG